MFSLFSTSNNIEDINNKFFGKNKNNEYDEENKNIEGKENTEDKNYLYQIINNNLIFKKYLISIVEYVNLSSDNNYNDLIKNMHKYISLPEDDDIIIIPDNFKLNSITDGDIKYKFFHNKSDIPNEFDIKMCKNNLAKYYLYIYLIINIFYKEINDDKNLNDIINIYISNYNIKGGLRVQDFTRGAQNFTRFISDMTKNKEEEEEEEEEEYKEPEKEEQEPEEEEEIEEEQKTEAKSEIREEEKIVEPEPEPEIQVKSDVETEKDEDQNVSLENYNDNNNNDNYIYEDINRNKNLESNVVLSKFNNKSSIKELIDYLKDLINKESIDAINLSKIVNNIEDNINLYEALIEDEKISKRIKEIKEINSNESINNFINNDTNNNKYLKKILKEVLDTLVRNNNDKNNKIYDLLKNNIINIREKDNTELNKNLTFKTLKTTLKNIINVLIETEIFVYDKIEYIINKSKQKHSGGKLNTRKNKNKNKNKSRKYNKKSKNKKNKKRSIKIIHFKRSIKKI
jgi:hypothetical protein